MSPLLRACVLTILLFPVLAARSGNDPAFFLRHYDNRNGLSNSAINCIYPDASNLLWIATWDGLNMYDGSAFHVFNYSKERDFRNIGSNVIRHVTEDRPGNIWVTTIEGISRYDKYSGRFYNYFYKQRQQGRVSEQEYALVTDTAGQVYCLDRQTGLNRYDVQADSFVRAGVLLPGKAVVKLLFDAANRLWVLDGEGQVSVFARAPGERFTRLFTMDVQAPVTGFFRVEQAVLLVTAGNKLYRYNHSPGRAEWIMDLPQAPAAIVLYKERYFFAWASRGFGVYDQQFRPADFLREETSALQAIRITSLAIGGEDILWFGSDGNGIIKVYPQTKSFGTIGTADDGLSYNRAVRAFCAVEGDLWVGTKGSGIIVYRNFWQAGSAARKNLTAPAVLDNNSVYALTRGMDGLIYIGTDGKGIGVYDPVRGISYRWSDIKGSDAWPEFGSVYAIREDTDRSLWLGTSGYGLVHLAFSRDRDGVLTVSFLERFQFNNSDHGPANDIIYALAEEGADQLWVGCRYGGLNLFDKRTRLFKTFKAFTYEGSLSNNDVLSLYRDSRDRLWVGTSYGLNWMDTRAAMHNEPLFHKFTTAEGLPNNTVHAITEDSSGHVWVSTNKGLARIALSGEQIAYYQQGDGLQSNEFSDGAVWKDWAGRLFFGGAAGFNHFFPADIRSTGWQPNLLLSGLLIGGKDAGLGGYQVLDTAGTQVFHAEMNRKDNFFELDIRALSFLNAEKCEYAWLLEGYDKDWHYSGTSGKINYSNIPPGRYSLLVKWSNGEGAWTKETRVMGVRVLQYVLLRWYALAFYGIVAALLFYIIYVYRKNKQEIRHQLEIEHRLREKDEAMHENRMGFFTNIAHELQTPLTLIMGSAERLMEKSHPYFTSLIHQQASRLTYLVQQLLDFRKGEAGFSRNQYGFLDVSQLLHHLAGAFMPLSERNAIEYEVQIGTGIAGWMDKDKLEKIVFNLLSNAFKYSDKKEQVLFRAAERVETRELEMVVVNSCQALPAAVIKRLFDQFYVHAEVSAGSGHFGTGIGLAFTRQLVHLLNGRITVAHDNDRISFTVTIPLVVEEMDNQPPMEVPAASDQPSLLYRSVTSHPLPLMPASAADSNKQALLDALGNDRRSNVLLVEDDEDIRFLVKDLLKNDYIIHEAMDGLKALELMEQVAPDLVICDVMMPHLSGLEFCHRVKNAPATCHIPVIMLSARGGEDHHMEGYEVGADAYIPKPFHSAYLLLRVRKMLEYRRKLVEVFRSSHSLLELEQAELPGDDKAFLTEVLRVIGENLTEEGLNALLLEKTFNLSKMQLYRKIKTLTGMTPGELIRLTRLRQAADLLVNTQLSVTEIFYRTGFNNQSYFFREFRKTYQCAPGEYRERRGIV